MKPIRVGICGLGTVGAGTFNVLKDNAADIARRLGRNIEVTIVAVRSDKPGFDFGSAKVVSDVFEVAKSPDVDVLVELIGGCDTALSLVNTAIEQGKHVVTANKALIAEYGNALFEAAEKQGVSIAFEAGVAGGIPIIKALREGFSGNQINWLAGIINGTGNFILTEMRDKGRAFNEVLAEAQALGYAEADPTFDVEGIDAAHKLAILASIAFGVPLQFDKVYTEGISGITREDVVYAEELGYRIKHLGIAKCVDAGVELRVHPTLIPEEALLANVNGVMNAVMVHGDAVGPTLCYGAGAGAGPTASAVVADVIDLARTINNDQDSRVPHLAFKPDALSDLPVLPIDQIQSAYYLRILVQDEAGIMAKVGGLLGDQGISIEAVSQKEPLPEGEQATLILLTRVVSEHCMNTAIDAIEAESFTVGKVVRWRVEQL